MIMASSPSAQTKWEADSNSSMVMSLGSCIILD